MLTFWMTILIGGWWFGPEIYDIVNDQLNDWFYSYTYDRFYFCFKNEETNIKMFEAFGFSEEFYEVIYPEINSNEEAIKVLTGFGLDMSKYNLNNDLDTHQLFIDFLKQVTQVTQKK